MTSVKPFLETDRVIIREWQAEDWRLLLPMSLDPDVMQYIGHYQPWTEEETLQFVTNRMADYEQYGGTMWPLILKETGAFVGYSGFLRRGYGQYKGEIEIGYALAKDAWGRGLAAEAGARILQYGFEIFGFERVIASARPENARSIRVMEKMGMRPSASGSTTREGPFPTTPSRTPTSPSSLTSDTD